MSDSLTAPAPSAPMLASDRARHDNALELRVFALRRSGHHAVMNWVLANTSGRYCFLNDCRPKHPPFHVARIVKNPDHWLQTNIEGLDYRAEAAGRHAPKDLMIYNYEDRRLKEVETRRYRRERTAWLGTSARRRDLLILRDPLNLVASRLKKFLPRITNRKRWYRRMTVDLWLEQARAAVAGGGFEDPIVVNYNRFVEEPQARAATAAALGFDATDDALAAVPAYGGGSSFTGLERAPTPQELTARWRSFADDPYFASFFRDPAVLGLAETLFGDRPYFPPMRDYLQACARR